MIWGGEHTIQYIDDILEDCTPETYIILLTNVTPINSLKINKYIFFKGKNTLIEKSNIVFFIEMAIYGRLDRAK